MTDYEKAYQQKQAVCGDPFPELVAFFKDLTDTYVSVLDLGCGQGRDALMIASFGHTVYGVDLAPTGIAQMLARAKTLKLKVDGEIADIRNYRPEKTYDVVVLDRIIHMLPTSAEKLEAVRMAADSTADRGYLLIVDTPSNIPLIERTLTNEKWLSIFRKKGFRFFQKHAGSV